MSVRIVQPSDRVWLEITQEQELGGYLKDQKVTRTDLGFISDGVYDNAYFSPADSVSTNADKFVIEYDAYSIVMTTDLFHESACDEVNREHNPHRSGKV